MAAEPIAIPNMAPIDRTSIDSSYVDVVIIVVAGSVGIFGVVVDWADRSSVEDIEVVVGIAFEVATVLVVIMVDVIVDFGIVSSIVVSSNRFVVVSFVDDNKSIAVVV